MIYIGNHLSSSKGFLAMGKEATKLGGDTFAFFTRNPRGKEAKEIDPADAEALMKYLSDNNFGKLVAHASYTMNVCSSKEDIRDYAVDMLCDDLKRMEYIPGNYYNFHPGSHTGLGEEKAIELIAKALNKAVLPEYKSTILLETMAGKGSEMGRNFEEIKAIIDRVEYKDKIGVCLDTCHIWDGGYDVARNIDGVLKTFDEVIGLDRLKAIHLNDSMNEMGSHKDRHEKIGLGKIGEEAMKRIVNHPLLQGKPFILETPNDDAGYKAEISMIRNWMQA